GTEAAQAGTAGSGVEQILEARRVEQPVDPAVDRGGAGVGDAGEGAGRKLAEPTAQRADEDGLLALLAGLLATLPAALLAAFAFDELGDRFHGVLADDFVELAHGGGDDAALVALTDFEKIPEDAGERTRGQRLGLQLGQQGDPAAEHA